MSFGAWLALFQIEGTYSSGWYPIYKLGVDSNWKFQLQGQDLNGVGLGGGQSWNQVMVQTTTSVPKDQWFHVEWYTHIGTDGKLAVWINGVKLWDVNADTSSLTVGGQNSAYKWYVMPDLYGTNGQLWVDDMAIYNVNMNGVTK